MYFLGLVKSETVNGQCLFLRAKYTYIGTSVLRADEKLLVLSSFLLSLPWACGKEREKKMGRYSGCRWRDIYNFHCSSTIRPLPPPLFLRPPLGCRVSISSLRQLILLSPLS
jgi:hypothetical protein